MTDALAAVGVGLVGALVGYVLRELIARITVGSADERAAAIVDQAERDAADQVAATERRLAADAEARERAFEEALAEKEQALDDERDAIARREKACEQRVAVLERKERWIEETTQRLEDGEATIAQREKRLDEQLAKETRELERIARMSADEAEAALLQRLAAEVEGEMASVITSAVARADGEVDERARRALLAAIQRLAVEHTGDHVVSTVDIPNDEMKGRIIGREGRNIRAFEQATGVDVIIDDTPGVIVVSGFDPLRREVARRSMEKLVVDGRIHPARIEEVVAGTRDELDEIVEETGRQACYDLNVHGLHTRLVAMLGQLKYRVCLGENVLDHSVRVAQVAGLLADELKLDRALARRAGLLHDIGKALDHELEGSHAAVGADFARRCDEPPEVVGAIAAHHDEVSPDTHYAVLVQIANRISRARPVRQGNLEKFVQRMEKLEAVAAELDGVLRVHAIRAGREVRVMVDPDQTDDERAVLLCRRIAREVKEAMSYPNELRVTLLRERRVVEYSL